MESSRRERGVCRLESPFTFRSRVSHNEYCSTMITVTYERGGAFLEKICRLGPSEVRILSVPDMRRRVAVRSGS